MTVTPQHAILPTVIYKNFDYNLLKLDIFFFPPCTNIDDLGKMISVLPLLPKSEIQEI